MISPPPIFVLIAGLPILAVLLAILGLFSAFPRSRLVTGAWIALLVLALWTWAWISFLSPNRLEFWKPPSWFPAVPLTANLILPFATSYLLRRGRLNGTHRMTGGAMTLIILFVWVASWTAAYVFQRTCVFYDPYHDGGQAWCPQSWQATSGI